MATRRTPSVLSAALLAIATTAGAQNLSSSSIDGTVTDQSGGALPGVTLPAAGFAARINGAESPTALIWFALPGLKQCRRTSARPMDSGRERNAPIRFNTYGIDSGNTIVTVMVMGSKSAVASERRWTERQNGHQP